MATKTTTRAPKFVAKPTIVEDVTALHEETSHGTYDDLMAQFSMSKRELLASVIGLITSGALGYAGSYLSAYMLVGALAMTGSAFLSYMIWFLASVLVIAASITAGARVQRIIVDGSLDRSISKLGNTIAMTTTGWYNSTVAMFNSKEAAHV